MTCKVPGLVPVIVVLSAIPDPCTVQVPVWIPSRLARTNTLFVPFATASAVISLHLVVAGTQKLSKESLTSPLL